MRGKYVSTHCPLGYSYVRHVCGDGATEWKGEGSVESGPFYDDERIFLPPELFNDPICSIDCNCKTIAVECSRSEGIT